MLSMLLFMKCNLARLARPVKACPERCTMTLLLRDLREIKRKWHKVRAGPHVSLCAHSWTDRPMGGESTTCGGDLHP